MDKDKLFIVLIKFPTWICPSGTSVKEYRMKTSVRKKDFIIYVWKEVGSFVWYDHTHEMIYALGEPKKGHIN